MFLPDMTKTVQPVKLARTTRLGQKRDAFRDLYHDNRVHPNKGTKPTTGLCGISDAQVVLSDSAFARVHTATEDLPPPGPHPTGNQTAELHHRLSLYGYSSHHQRVAD